MSTSVEAQHVVGIDRLAPNEAGIEREPSHAGPATTYLKPSTAIDGAGPLPHASSDPRASPGSTVACHRMRGAGKSPRVTCGVRHAPPAPVQAPDSITPSRDAVACRPMTGGGVITLVGVALTVMDQLRLRMRCTLRGAPISRRGNGRIANRLAPAPFGESSSLEQHRPRSSVGRLPQKASTTVGHCPCARSARCRRRCLRKKKRLLSRPPRSRVPYRDGAG